MRKEKIFFLNCLMMSLFLKSDMQVHEYKINLFQKEPVPTERSAYEIFKKKSLPHEMNYVAIPWCHFINSKRIEEIPDLHFDGGCTVCQHIDYKKIIPTLQRMGIDFLFTPHAKKNEVHGNVTVLPFPHYAVNGVDPAQKKDIFYSFVGASSTHKTRKQLLKMKHPADTIVQERVHWHFARDTFKPGVISKEEQAQYKDEYQEVLARSRFSLCPRGTGPSTIRFWESLQAGAIPVLFGYDLVLPAEFDWDQCVITIPVEKIQDVAKILSAISPEKEQSMRQHCLQAYKQYSGDNFISTILLHYGRYLVG